MAYDKDDGTHRFIRSLMALPFLSVQEIEAQFDCMHQNCPPGPLEDLVNYVETTWINAHLSAGVLEHLWAANTDQQ